MKSSNNKLNNLIEKDESYKIAIEQFESIKQNFKGIKQNFEKKFYIYPTISALEDLLDIKLNLKNIKNDLDKYKNINSLKSFTSKQKKDFNIKMLELITEIDDMKNTVNHKIESKEFQNQFQELLKSFERESKGYKQELSAINNIFI